MSSTGALVSSAPFITAGLEVILSHAAPMGIT